MLQLAGNPLVQELPTMGGADPVGDDIADIPRVLRLIKQDWMGGDGSIGSFWG